MLDLGLAAATEVLGVAIRGEASRVEEANRRLHAQLVLERVQRGGGVEGPVTPGGAGEAVLEEHTDDRHHRQTAVRDPRSELLGLLSRVRGGQHLEAEVTRGSRSARGLVLGGLAEGHVGQDLSPASGRHLGDGGEAVGHIRELQARGRGEVARQLAGDLLGGTSCLTLRV